MKVSEIMTKDPACCTTDDTVQAATRMMREQDCGAIPVVADRDSRKLVGVITDRDVATRVVAEGKGSDTSVRDAMSPDPSCCSPQDDVKAVERLMSERQVRRVPIVDDAGRVVGIVAQADLARDDRAVSDREVGRVVEKISEPTRA